jgi:3-mercaptopyruvate sulfurtransferase SseA
MKILRIMPAIALFSLLFVIGCQQTATTKSMDNKVNANKPAAPADIARISIEDAKKAVEAGTAVIIDTRSAEAYKAEHIKGSLNIPTEETAKRIAELPKDKQLIFYCS